MNTQAISSNASVFKNKFLNDLASSALLWKAKAFVVANIAYYAMSSKIREAKNKEQNETNTLHTRISIVNRRLHGRH